MNALKSRELIWDDLVGVRSQIKELAVVYVKHGDKAHRKREIQLLAGACVWIARTHHLNSIHGIGKDHVNSFWRAHRQLDHSLICAYWHAFCAFYELMCRRGEPPRPRLSQPLDESW